MAYKNIITLKYVFVYKRQKPRYFLGYAGLLVVIVASAGNREANPVPSYCLEQPAQ